jgi:phosphinothricin acetyltransferase
MEKPAFTIRPCFEHDLDQVRLIYAHHVTTGTGTFETAIPDFEEMRTRWRKVVAAGWPYLVSTPVRDPTRIVAFCYAQPFRDRAAYAHTVEDSVYVAPGFERKGVGAACLEALLIDLQVTAAQQVIAVIGDSGNVGSRAVHARLGFNEVGIMRSVGYKFGRWLDAVIMQRDVPRPAAGAV